MDNNFNKVEATEDGYKDPIREVIDRLDSGALVTFIFLRTNVKKGNVVDAGPVYHIEFLNDEFYDFIGGEKDDGYQRLCKYLNDLRKTPINVRISDSDEIIGTMLCGLIMAAEISETGITTVTISNELWPYFN